MSLSNQTLLPEARVTLLPHHEVIMHRDAERLARGTPQAQTLIVAGGDGTANEAANGRLAAGGGRLALIPLGTAGIVASVVRA